LNIDMRLQEVRLASGRMEEVTVIVASLLHATITNCFSLFL
jgi:hypothetical protein